MAVLGGTYPDHQVLVVMEFRGRFGSMFQQQFFLGGVMAVPGVVQQDVYKRQRRTRSPYQPIPEQMNIALDIGHAKIGRAHV